jgi:hypothetical protein
MFDNYPRRDTLCHETYTYILLSYNKKNYATTFPKPQIGVSHIWDTGHCTFIVPRMGNMGEKSYLGLKSTSDSGLGLDGSVLARHSQPE